MCTCRRLGLCRVLAAPFLWGLLCAASPLKAAENQALAAALNSITAPELGHHVDVLADDTFEGREAGSRGGRAAGGYLVQLFEEYHIQPAGEDGGYFQTFGAGYRNVLGMIEGRDPQLKHEFIILGAHYDHVGYGNSRNSFGPTGYIHNGADDNASGTSGLIEVMQAFTMLPQPPRRTILFAFWDGEEKGLLGSKHWVAYPTVSLKNVVLAFNSDMIGRLNKQRVEVYGARTARGLRQLVSEQNSGYGLQLDFMWDVTANSDHYSFFERNIPFLMLHTGLHENYHRPSDDPETINREGMQTVSQLLFRIIYEAAEAEQLAPFRSQARQETNFTRSQFERTAPASPPRLGVSWSREDDLAGLLLTSVTQGSPGEMAGLRTGDRIVRFDGRDVESGDQFRLIVLAAESDTQAVIQRPGEPEPIEVEIHLAGKPVRIGISWDEDRADSAMVILTKVVPGSAAQQAGLALKDRVYAVAGHKFADGDEFGQLVTQGDGPVELLVERQGILRSVTVSPLEDPVQFDAVDTSPDPGVH